METTSTDTRRVQASPAGITLRALLRSWTSAIAGAVAGTVLAMTRSIACA